MKVAALTALAVAALASTPALAFDNDKDGDDFQFPLIRSKGLVNFPTVAPNAQGSVKIESVGPVEIMKVKVWGLPANTDFDFFVIQVPNAPFGLAWYQGDIETDSNGNGQPLLSTVSVSRPLWSRLAAINVHETRALNGRLTPVPVTFLGDVAVRRGFFIRHYEDAGPLPGGTPHVAEKEL